MLPTHIMHIHTLTSVYEHKYTCMYVHNYYIFKLYMQKCNLKRINCITINSVIWCRNHDSKVWKEPFYLITRYIAVIIIAADKWCELCSTIIVLERGINLQSNWAINTHHHHYKVTCSINKLYNIQDICTLVYCKFLICYSLTVQIFNRKRLLATYVAINTHKSIYWYCKIINTLNITIT